MKSNRIMCLAVVTLFIFSFACQTTPPPPGVQTGPGAKAQSSATPPSGDVPAALPDKAFKAEITLVDPPAKLRAGQKETIRIKIKNASDSMWWARGGRVNTRNDNKYYIAVGDRWLKSDGSLLTNMDGRYGIPKDLAAAEETEVPLSITAPKEPGDYTLEIDLVQEQVAWFSEKGSPTAKTKISVVK
jgi:hypothetical protein